MAKEFKVQTDQEHQEVSSLGGLHIIGTERHEARRIDNQLRGRAGRQGDPGSTRFFLSLEDQLMRIFGGQAISKLMDMINAEEDMPIESGMVSNSIEKAQKKVEAHHFDMRKHVLQYDDVLSSQREVIYRERRRILERANLKDGMADMLREHLDLILEAHIDPDSQPELWEEEDLPSVLAALSMDIPMFAEIKAQDLHNFSYDDLRAKLYEDMMHAYAVREEHIGTDDMREFERQVLLHNIDTKWVDYLHNIDLLRDGIQMRAYAQKDPLQEYKREAFNMFNLLLRAVQAESIQHIFRAQPQMSEINGMFEIPEELLRPENFPEGMTPDTFFAMLQDLMEKQLQGEGGEEDEETAKHRAYLMEAMQAAEAEHRALTGQPGGDVPATGDQAVGDSAAPDTTGGDKPKIDLNAKRHAYRRAARQRTARAQSLRKIRRKNHLMEIIAATKMAATRGMIKANRSRARSRLKQAPLKLKAQMKAVRLKANLLQAGNRSNQ